MTNDKLSSLILIVAGYALLFWTFPHAAAVLLGIHLILSGVN